MKSKMLVFGLALVLGALILSSCSSGKASVDLAGSEWVLTSLSGNSVLEDTEITLSFEAESLSGSAGCNGYSADKYTAKGNGTLAITGTLAVTVELCPSPKGIMEQEKAYIGALLNAATYQLIEERLEIDDASGETALVFARPE